MYQIEMAKAYISWISSVIWTRDISLKKNIDTKILSFHFLFKRYLFHASI